MQLPVASGGPIFSPAREKIGEKRALGYDLVRSASDFRREPMFQASFHTRVTSRASWYAPPDTGVSSLRRVAFESLRQNVLRIKIIGQYGFALDFQLSREKSRKTEGIFLVGSRESEGKSKSPPNREFSSRFGKEEMSTEDKRRRLRRLVPPWSFLTRQRFLLEKQKKMLCRSR